MAWNLYEKISCSLSFRLLDQNEILRKLKKLNYEQPETEKNLKSYQVKRFLNDLRFLKFVKKRFLIFVKFLSLAVSSVADPDPYDFPGL